MAGFKLAKYTFNQWFLDSGAVNNAGTVTVYDAGTVNLSSIYSDSAGTALDNPFTLSASGRVQTGDLFLDDKLYDVVIKDSSGTTIETVDDLDGGLGAGVTLTAGSILFANASGGIAQDNANLYWDDTNNRLGLGDTSPGTQLDMASTVPYITLHNTTEEDTDGGRESRLIFEGEQSGGEITTLAQIQASHDGASDDQKGDLIFYTNDGTDGTSPTERLRIDSAGLHTITGDITATSTTITFDMGSFNFVFGDSGSLTNTFGTINFGDENLTTTGDVTGANLTSTGTGITIANGGYIGSVGVGTAIQIEADGDVLLNQRIATSSGDYWDIADYSAGTAAASTGAVVVVINGTTYYLEASTSAPS